MEKTEARQIRIPAQIPVILALLPFFEPQGLSFMSSVDALYTAAMGAAVLVVLFVYIRGGEYSRLFILLALFRAVLLAEGIVSGHSVSNAWVSRTVVSLGIVMTVEIAMRYDALAAVEGIFAILFANITLNLVTCLSGGLLLYQTQLYYWSGIRTRFTDSIIPAIALALLISWKRWERILTPLSIATIVVGMAQLLTAYVATGIVACVMLLAAVFVFRKRPGSAPPAAFIFAPLVLNLLIVFGRIQDVFSVILVDVLHKSITFSGRTQIWAQAVTKFWNSPVLGVGEHGNGGLARVYWSARLVPAHNTVMQILYDGGAVCAVLWLLIFLYCARKLRRYRGSMAVLFIAAGFLAAGFEMITETVHYFPFFYVLPAVAANIGRLEEQTERRDIVLYFH